MDGIASSSWTQSPVVLSDLIVLFSSRVRQARISRHASQFAAIHQTVVASERVSYATLICSNRLGASNAPIARPSPEVRMKYVAWLRGINVGGNNPIKMSALKSCLEGQGFDRVATYIQSGNVIFETKERSSALLTRRIEQTLDTTFGVEIPIVLLSSAQLKTVVDGAPAQWKQRSDLRRNVAFLRPPLTASQALKDVDTKPDVDVVTAGKGVLYMSTVMSALKSSRLNRLVTKSIYRDMTIRNYNTCRKVLALMDERGS